MNGQSPPQPRSEWEAPRTEGSDPTAGSPAGALDARPDVVILTGMSGAGRSTAAHAMEDAGWYVVDNLPPSMLPALYDETRAAGITRLAVVLDFRCTYKATR